MWVLVEVAPLESLMSEGYDFRWAFIHWTPERAHMMLEQWAFFSCAREKQSLLHSMYFWPLSEGHIRFVKDSGSFVEKAFTGDGFESPNDKIYILPSHFTMDALSAEGRSFRAITTDRDECPRVGYSSVGGNRRFWYHAWVDEVLVETLAMPIALLERAVASKMDGC